MIIIIVHRGIVDVQGSFFNPEKELCFVGIVDCLRRPFCQAAFIVVERAGVDPLKGALFCHDCTFNHLPEPG